MLTIEALAIPDVKLLTPQLHRDDRGYLAEILQAAEMEKAGLPAHYVQENQSLSRAKGTVRGLHGQRPPNAQAKLVRVLQGAIFDVAVDMRPDSKTYGQYVSAELSEDNLRQLYIPAGFLHGFCTLTADTIVLYKMSNFYAPASEVAVRWDDPDLAIHWPLADATPVLSGKDQTLGSFKAFPKVSW